jgi:hypothetical protein
LRSRKACEGGFEVGRGGRAAGAAAAGAAALGGVGDVATLALGRMSMARAAWASWEAREASAEPCAFLVADLAARINAWVGVRGRVRVSVRFRVQGYG